MCRLEFLEAGSSKLDAGENRNAETVQKLSIRNLDVVDFVGFGGKSNFAELVDIIPVLLSKERAECE